MCRPCSHLSGTSLSSSLRSRCRSEGRRRATGQGGHLLSLPFLFTTYRVPSERHRQLWEAVLAPKLVSAVFWVFEQSLSPDETQAQGETPSPLRVLTGMQFGACTAARSQQEAHDKTETEQSRKSQRVRERGGRKSASS